MEKKEIAVNGTAFPCRQTMGAMLRFKRETGKEVTEIKGDVSDLCTYLWCCVASASKHDGIDFDLSLMDFADSIATKEVTAWANAINEGADDGGGEKKSR